jgi:hypothetical protein
LEGHNDRRSVHGQQARVFPVDPAGGFLPVVVFSVQSKCHWLSSLLIALNSSMPIDLIHLANFCIVSVTFLPCLSGGPQLCDGVRCPVRDSTEF